MERKDFDLDRKFLLNTDIILSKISNSIHERSSGLISNINRNDIFGENNHVNGEDQIRMNHLIINW